MTDVEQSLLDFHKSFGAYYNETPTIPPQDTQALRIRLLREEYQELIDELLLSEAGLGNLEAIATEAIDLVYVTVGLCLAFGIPFNDVFAGIHEANMRKLVDCPTCAVEYYELTNKEPQLVSEGCEVCKFTGKVSLKDPGGKMMKPPGWQKADVASILNQHKEQ